MHWASDQTRIILVIAAALVVLIGIMVAQDVRSGRGTGFDALARSQSVSPDATPPGLGIPAAAAPPAATPGETPASATPVAATPMVSAFASGGLGLTVEEFEDRYDRFGAGVETERGRVYQTTNGEVIAAARNGTRIDFIQRTLERRVSLRAARTTALRLAPADAVLVGTEVTAAGVTVDRYASPALAVVLPNPGDYPDAAPGEFTVRYGDYNPDAGNKAVTEFEITLGKGGA